MNLYEALAEAGRRHAGRAALIDGAGTLRYGDLWREIEALGAQLGMLGIGAGQGVGVLARNGRAFVIAALAALGRGAVVMPMYHQLKPGELAEILQRAPLAAIVDDGSCPHPLAGRQFPLTFSKLSGQRPDLPGAPLRLTRLAGPAPAPLIPWAPDAAFVRFTSGTTGASKGVILSHDGLLERLRVANAGLRLSHEDVVLCVLPMAFHFFVSVLLYLGVGAAVAVCPDPLAETIMEAAERGGATFLYAAPLHVRMLAADASGRALPPALRRVMSVSSALAPQAARGFQARFGVPVAQGYGIIEAGLPIVNVEDAAAHPEAIGRPLPGFEAAILDEGLNEMPEGATGQLALRGPGMFAGYMDPPLPRERILVRASRLQAERSPGWFLTGDLAHRDAAGLIFLDGRCKSVINVAGHKVFPEEVAAVLDSHPQVLRSRVTTRPHPQLGEAVHAEVESRNGQALNVEELLTYCRRRLSSYKVPASIELAGELAQTASGKVRHGN